MSNVRLAKSNGRFNERLQDRPQIESRPADHLEHVSGGGLLRQRFAEGITLALTSFRKERLNMCRPMKTAIPGFLP
jgi:hypothetical protein